MSEDERLHALYLKGSLCGDVFHLLGVVRVVIETDVLAFVGLWCPMEGEPLTPDSEDCGLGVTTPTDET